MFVWSEPDFISALEAVPEEDEDAASCAFRVERDGLRLLLTVFELDGAVYFTLWRDGVEQPVFDFQLADCPGARRVAGQDGREYLEFAAAGVYGGRYDGESVIPHGVRVAAVPHIWIQLF